MLSNPKHEHFAQLIAKGNITQAQAAITAGYAEKGSAIAGSKMANNAKIATRIEELRRLGTERAIQSISVDRIWIIQKLVEIVTKCTSDQRYNPSAATKSLELLGKDLGMFRDYIRIEVFTEKMARMGEVVAKYCDAEVLDKIAADWERIANELPAGVTSEAIVVKASEEPVAQDQDPESS